MTHREYHAFAFGAHNYDASRGASLALFSHANLGEASAQATATEVTDPSGATAGRCTTPGLRYFRYPLPQESSTATHFFSIRVEKNR